MPLPEKSDTPAPNPKGGPLLDFLPPSVPKSPLAFHLLPNLPPDARTHMQVLSPLRPPTGGTRALQAPSHPSNPGPDQKKHATPTRVNPGPWGRLDAGGDRLGTSAIQAQTSPQYGGAVSP